MRAILVGVCATACVDVSPCVEEPLELWCRHDESVEGPTSDLPCDPPEAPPPAPSCGDYTLETTSGGYTSITHYFLDDAHVAVRYTTDTNHYCGGFDFWYGERIRCP